MKKVSAAKMIAMYAVLAALYYVLSLWSIGTNNFKITLGSLPLILAGLICGPLGGLCVGAVGEFLYQVLYYGFDPTTPLWLLPYICAGVCAGLFAKKNKYNLSTKKIILAITVSELLIFIIVTPVNYLAATIQGWGNWAMIVAGIPLRFAIIIVTIVILSIIIPPIYRGVRKALGITGTGAKKGMTENEAIAYIENYTWSSTRLGLERTRELLDKIGNPQKGLKFIHVTGSNGKGSTCSMLAKIFEEAGYRVGMYTSPYIQDFCERIQINGVNIPGATLARITEKVKAVAEGMEDHPSQFELVTAIGMQYFLEEKVDIVMLEVGMGGALDSTNVIDAPEVAIITNIGLEHTEYLGNTITAIAETKSGIIKPGCNCVCYDGDPEATTVIKRVCAEQNIPLTCCDFTKIEPIEETLSYQRFRYEGEEYQIGLLGPHQLCNACVVIETVKVMRERGWNVSEEALKDGLAATSWPARFEVMGNDPLFILDGGHNPQCAQALAESIRTTLGGRKVVFLMGVLADKDYNQIVDTILPYADQFVCLTPFSDRALAKEDFAKFLESKGAKAAVAEDVEEGVRKAIELAGNDGTVIGFGSLYIAGYIRSEYQKNWQQKA